MPTNFLRRTHQFAASVFHKRIGFRKNIVQRLASGDTILEFLSDARKILVREVLYGGKESLSLAIVGEDEKIALSIYMRRSDANTIEPKSKALFESLWDKYKN